MLIQVWHPDRFEGQPRIRTQAEEKLKSINSAYRRIQDAGFPGPPDGPGGSAQESNEDQPPRTPQKATFWCPWCGKRNRLPSEYAFEDVTCGACRQHFRIDLSGEAVRTGGDEAATTADEVGDAGPGRVHADRPRPPSAAVHEDRMPLFTACPWCWVSNWVIGRRKKEAISCASCGGAFELDASRRAVRRAAPPRTP